MSLDEQLRVGEVTSPTARMTEFHSGLRMALLLSVLAELGVADELAEGALPVDELAARAGADPGSLYRALRAVASQGVFTELRPRVFGLTELAHTLRTGVDGSMRDIFRLQGQPFMLHAYADLGHSVRTGGSAFDHVHGSGLFSYLAARPDMSELFSRAMGNSARQVQRAAIETYDLSAVQRLVDVGGAHGHLVSAVLRRYPHMTAVVFDRPEVVPGAAQVLAEAGVSDRAELVGGDYFTSVPAGADAYVISHVIHQLSDPEAVTVLRNIRAAMDTGGQVIILDPVLPEGDTPHPGKFMDITMMALTGGRDRTEAEIDELLSTAGLVLIDTIDLAAPSSVVVAAAA